MYSVVTVKKPTKQVGDKEVNMDKILFTIINNDFKNDRMCFRCCNSL